MFRHTAGYLRAAQAHGADLFENLGCGKPCMVGEFLAAAKAHALLQAPRPMPVAGFGFSALSELEGQVKQVSTVASVWR